MPPAKKIRPSINREDSSAAYKPTCILVTGGAGFIASHIVIQLVKQYPQYKVCERTTSRGSHAHMHTQPAPRGAPPVCQIVCFDKIDYCSSVKNFSSVENAPNFKFVKGNLLSADLIK